MNDDTARTRKEKRKRLSGRLGIILLLALLMAAGVVVVGEMVRQAAWDASPRVAESEPLAHEVLARQTGQYWTLRDPPRPPQRLPGATDADARGLAEAYERRAFPGAPPSIPHPVAAELATGELCLSCHGHGGWTPKFEAYAPVTPHPQLGACQQCHVATTVSGTFRPSTFRAESPPELGQAALPGSPPPLPHALRMRESCTSCHAGPSAPPEIRTTHPERVGCLQCHVPREEGETWSRALAPGIPETSGAPREDGP